MKRGNPRLRQQRREKRQAVLQAAVDQQQKEQASLERRLSRRITARKYMGDDSESWSVFLDGRPVYNGMNRRSVPYYRSLVLDILKQREREGK